MKKNNKILLAFFIVVVLVIVLLITNKVFLLKDENFYNYHNFTRQERNTIDILVLGSSHSRNGIDANRLDALLSEQNISVKSFNMSITGLRFEMMAYRLKEVLKTQTPKLLIVETFSAVPIGYSDADITRRYAIDYMPLTWNKLQYINHYIEEEKNSYIFPLLRYHSRWKELTKEDFLVLNSSWLDSTSRQNGLVAFTEDVAWNKEDDYFTKDFSDLTEEMPLESEVDKALQELLQVAKKNQIEVLFVSLPFKVQMGYTSEQLVQNNAYIQNHYCDENTKLLDFNRNYEALQWSFQDMQDEGHMNASGRQKIMPVLADFIEENYF